MEQTQERHIKENWVDFQYIRTHTNMSVQEIALQFESRAQKKKTKTGVKQQTVLIIDEVVAGDFYSHICKLFIAAGALREEIRWVIITMDKSISRMVTEQEAYREYLNRHLKGLFPQIATVIR